MLIINRLMLIAVLACSMLPAYADNVSATLPSGVVVNADYRPRNPDLPVLVVLHGFLQTDEFQATHNIIEGLAGLGYTVLGPNLSLGISNRRKSLACEALHKHTLSDDVAEIDFWVNWLLLHGHKQVILVGHSWGGQHALAFAQLHPDKPIKGIVAVSLVRAAQHGQAIAAEEDSAMAKPHSEPPSLKPYKLNFCRKYVGTPESYLSYAVWTDTRVIQSLKDTRAPVYVILGGNDRRADPEWMTALADTGANVAVVKNADHFFSSLYEFDLVDALQVALDRLSTAE